MSWGTELQSRGALIFNAGALNFNAVGALNFNVELSDVSMA